MRPRVLRQHLGSAGHGIAQVDAVQAQQRQTRRKTARRGAEMLAEGLYQVFAQHGIGLQPPIVEIAGDDYRRLGRQAVEQVQQQLYLALPVGLAQAEVHAHRMYLVMARHLQLAVQQPALLVALHRDVQVVEAADGEFRQQRVAVVPMGYTALRP